MGRFSLGIVAITFLAILEMPAFAGPYEDALAATQNGNYEAALRIWTPLAEAGEARAQFNLGVANARGHGGRQDAVRALVWLNLSISTLTPSGQIRSAALDDGARGRAIEMRNTVVGWLTSKEKAEALSLERDWSNRWRERSGTRTTDTPTKQGSGSGFVVSKDGHILTNAHVVDGCRGLSVVSADGRRRSQATVANANRRDDLAVLQSDFRISPAAFSREAVRIGADVIVYGFPLSGTLASTGNVAAGIVSGLAGLRDDPRHYQVSAPVQPGNSGGPLLDMSGNVVGIVVGKLSSSAAYAAWGDLPQNVNFAVKGRTALAFLESTGILFVTQNSISRASVSDVAARALKFTVRVECWK